MAHSRCNRRLVFTNRNVKGRFGLRCLWQKRSTCMIKQARLDIYAKHRMIMFQGGRPAFNICLLKVSCIECGVKRKTRSERWYCSKDLVRLKALIPYN